MHDCIIIGGGMAGLAAAIYLRRKDLQTLMLTIETGGRINLPKYIENYPGIKKIEAYKLPLTCKKQAEELGLEINYEKVNKISKNEDYFLVNNYATKTILLALGKSPRMLNIEGEKEFLGNGIDYNAKDFSKYKNKKVAIIGAGNSAFTSAKELRKIAKEITIIHRANLKADESLVNEVKSYSKLIKANPLEFKGDKKLKYILLDNDKQIKIDNVLLNIGYENDISFIKDLVKINKDNEIIINDKCETSHEGIYASGDCTSVPYKQCIIAAGEGAKAALSIYSYISGSKVKSDWAH